MASEHEPWQSNASGPFVTIEAPTGDVGIWSLGGDRFRVQTPSGEKLVERYAEAQNLAHELADAV